MVFGGAGCGKTFTIDRALHAFRGKGLEPIYANPTGYRDILVAYEEARETCGDKPSRVRPIFFDEADTIFASEKCLNILKVAFAPDRRQRVYNNMIVDAPVFISTNRKIDAFSAGKRPHIEAVFDRQPPIVVPDDPYASWEYPVDASDISQWADAKFGDRIVIAPRARRALTKSRHPEPRRIAEALEVLAGPKWRGYRGETETVAEFEAGLLKLRMRDGFSNAERLKGQSAFDQVFARGMNGATASRVGVE